MSVLRVFLLLALVAAALAAPAAQDSPAEVPVKEEGRDLADMIEAAVTGDEDKLGLLPRVALKLVDAGGESGKHRSDLFFFLFSVPTKLQNIRSGPSPLASEFAPRHLTNFFALVVFWILFLCESQIRVLVVFLRPKRIYDLVQCINSPFGVNGICDRLKNYGPFAKRGDLNACTLKIIFSQELKFSYFSN